MKSEREKMLAGELYDALDAEFDNLPSTLPEDLVEVLAQSEHRVVWTIPDTPTIWLEVFY